MKNLFPRILSLTILFLIFPVVSFAEVSQIGFTTDPQTIKPNTQSEKITIQTQDSSGSSVQTLETLYLSLTSISATGEFSSSETSWKDTDSVTMSKNSANRSFYYKDTTEGTFTITVNVTGKNWGSTQQIIISSDASQNSSSEVLSDSTSLSSSSSSSGESTTNVSTPNAQLEILAGSDRVTSPGSPIWFQAVVKKNTNSSSPELNWSFGDGNVETGLLVSHTYKYPGDYVVVLSARAGDIFSISRLKVKVADSSISVIDKGEYLEISNSGNTEVNLFNWKVENKGKGFKFQPNTIILPKSSIKLDKSLLTMKGLDNSLGTCLENSLGEEVFAVAPVKEVDLNEASKNLENIKKEFSAIQEKAKNIVMVPQIKTSLAIVSNKKIEKQTDFSDFGQITTSTENVIYEVPKESGILSKTWHFITNMLH